MKVSPVHHQTDNMKYTESSHLGIRICSAILRMGLFILIIILSATALIIVLVIIIQLNTSDKQGKCHLNVSSF